MMQCLTCFVPFHRDSFTHQINKITSFSDNVQNLNRFRSLVAKDWWKEHIQSEENGTQRSLNIQNVR